MVSKVSIARLDHGEVAPDALRRDGLDGSVDDGLLRPLPVLHLHEEDGLVDRVVVVDGELARERQVEATDREHLLAKVLAGEWELLLVERLVDRRDDIGRVVEILRVGQAVRLAADLLLPALDVRGDRRAVRHARRERGRDYSLGRRPELLNQLRVVDHGVGGNRLRKPELTHLRDDLGRVGDQPLDVDHVGLGRPNLEERAGPVRGFRVIRLIGNDLAARLGENVAVDLRGDRTGFIVDVDDCRFLLAHLRGRILCDGGDIDVGQREGCVGVLAQLSDIRRIRAYGELYDLVVVADGRDRLHDRRPGAHEGGYLLDRNQTVRRLNASLRVSARVEYQHLELLAVHTALLVDSR